MTKEPSPAASGRSTPKPPQQRANLNTLPYELLTQIISYLCNLYPISASHPRGHGRTNLTVASNTDRQTFRNLRLVCRSLSFAVTNKYTGAAYLSTYAHLFTNVPKSGMLFRHVHYGALKDTVRYLTIAEKTTSGPTVDARESMRALKRLGALRQLESVLFTCTSKVSRVSTAGGVTYAIARRVLRCLSPQQFTSPTSTDDETDDDDGGAGESYINNVLTLATPSLSTLDRLTKLWLCEWEPDAYPACETAEWHKLLSRLIILKIDCNATNDGPPSLGFKSTGKIDAFVSQFQRHWGPYLTSLKDFSLQASPHPDSRLNEMFYFPAVNGCPLRTGQMEGLYFNNIILTRDLLSFISSHKKLKRLRVDDCHLSTFEAGGDCQEITWYDVYRLIYEELKELMYFRPLLNGSHYARGDWGGWTPGSGDLSAEDRKSVAGKMWYWWKVIEMAENNALRERKRYEEAEKEVNGFGTRSDNALAAYISYFQGSPDYFIFE